MTKRHEESTFWEFQVNHLHYGMFLGATQEHVASLLAGEEDSITFHSSNHGPLTLEVAWLTSEGSIFFCDDEGNYWFMPPLPIFSEHVDFFPTLKDWLDRCKAEN